VRSVASLHVSGATRRSMARTFVEIVTPMITGTGLAIANDGDLWIELMLLSRVCIQKHSGFFFRVRL